MLRIQVLHCSSPQAPKRLIVIYLNRDRIMLREMCGMYVQGAGEVHLKVTGRSSYLRGYNWGFGDETTTGRIILGLM